MGICDDRGRRRDTCSEIGGGGGGGGVSMEFLTGRISGSRFFIGVLLVGVGLMLLLTSMDVVGGVFWSNLWPFWPVLVIGLGAVVLFRRRSAMLGTGILTILVGGSIAAAAVTAALGIDMPGRARGFDFEFGPGVRGSGVSTTVERSVGQLSRIRVDGSTDVDVTIGPERSVRVTADDNLVNFIRTDVHGGELAIGRDRNIRPRVETLVRIAVPDLESIEIHGSGDARVRGLNERDFEGSIDGSGSLDLRGETGSLKISVHGSGDVDAGDLHASDVDVSIIGSGDVRVYASNALDVSIQGSGDVAYSGNPGNVSENIQGSGSIDER